MTLTATLTTTQTTTADNDDSNDNEADDDNAINDDADNDADKDASLADWPCLQKVNTTVSRAGYFSQTPHHSIICNSKTAAKINLELVMYQLKDLSLATMKKNRTKKSFFREKWPQFD